MPRSAFGRLGRWCFVHWGWVLAIWVVAVAGGVAASGPMFSRLVDESAPKSAESVAAYSVINTSNGSSGTVVAVIDHIDPATPAVRDAVVATASRVSTMDGVSSVTQPFDPAVPASRAATLRATDGHAVLISVTLGEMERPERDRIIRPIGDELHRLAAALPAGATVEVGGAPLLSLGQRETLAQDLRRAERVSLPASLLVLVIVFGGLVAAGLPVLSAIASVTVAMAVMLGFSTFTDIDQNGVTVVSLLGLGLSVDYGLLLVARYREELVEGHAPDVAIARAWATAGRTIGFSALTVAASLTGLLMFDVPTLTSLGAAGVSIALVCMLVSLTFTAALIGLFRKRIRPRRAARASTADEDTRGFFARVARFVQRRAVVVAVATAAVLLTAGAPLLSLNLELPGLAGVPRTIEAARVADELNARFGRTTAPTITVVASTDPSTLDIWAARWRGDPAVTAVRKAVAAGDGKATVGIDVAGDQQGARARALVLRLRADRPPGGQSWVTGDAAVLNDLLDLIKSGLPAAVGLTLLAMMALLFAMTGSLVVPIKAVLANVVSLGATFGVLTAVFERGYGSDLLDTLTVGSLNPFVIVIVFGFAFGLSMDYEVFLLGRIKEYVDQGMPTDAAVRRGLQHTGRVITSAALLMVIVFSCFAAARMGNIEQIGLGLTIAVLIDATVVRCLLVPATMTLLGRWNWWAPGPLRRLHARLGLREQPLPAAPTRDNTTDATPLTVG